MSISESLNMILFGKISLLTFLLIYVEYLSIAIIKISYKSDPTKLIISNYPM